MNNQNHTSPAKGDEAERAAFEAWLRMRWPNAARPIDEKTTNGSYVFSENNLLWEAWQAARRAPAPVADGLPPLPARGAFGLGSLLYSESHMRQYASDAIAADRRRPKREIPPELKAAIEEAHKTGSTSALLPNGSAVFINYGHDYGDNSHLECTACGGSGHIEDQQARASVPAAGAVQQPVDGESLERRMTATLLEKTRMRGHTIGAVVAQLHPIFEAELVDLRAQLARDRSDAIRYRLLVDAAPGNTAQPVEQVGERPDGWHPITRPGQVKVGDNLRFTIGDDEYSETAKQILHPGTDKEEIIYNKRRNYYLITSMAMANKGSQKNVEFLPKRSTKGATDGAEGQS